jgi:hypothetical protein
LLRFLLTIDTKLEVTNLVQKFLGCSGGAIWSKRSLDVLVGQSGPNVPWMFWWGNLVQTFLGCFGGAIWSKRSLDVLVGQFASQNEVCVSCNCHFDDSES